MMQPGLAGDKQAVVAQAATAEDVAEHVKNLLFSNQVPELTPELACVGDLQDIHYSIIELRRQLGEYAKGDFSASIKTRGVIAGMVKALQANMRHLIWQMEQVRSGDLTQRVDFMGDFSVAFNDMVQQLDNALTALHTKEKQLTAITRELQQEVEKRGAALAALQKSEENFKYLAEHDPLTGLPNRRTFFARLEMELARNAITGQYTAIAVMDLDHFKLFNDTYGHYNGDAALRHVAQAGSATLRENDIMGRLGGEEFAFIFSKANPEKGRRAAERIRRLIAETPVILADGSAATLTASFGVLSIPPITDVNERALLLDKAYTRADKALYRAKSRGRNTVCLTSFPRK